ncbi:hypothetical protein LJC56_08625 [Christensenellaceae bacterium OttesenSCG-928-K19]|nr:hypothetical protein [Christensenellaceae bacterium OttesenSCG-928-K19]
MSALTKGMKQYKKVHFILTLSGGNIPSEALLENEGIKKSVDAVVKSVSDLPIVNAVLDVTDAGYSQSGVLTHVNSAIEELFRVRAKELLAGTTDIKRLQKWDKQIDSYTKKETGCRNHFKEEINSRIAELS